MDKTKLLHRIAYLIVFIFFLNFLALKLYWYSLMWYFDMLMHFSGGVWLGLVFLWLFGSRKISIGLVSKSIMFVLAVGLGWEFFEVLVYNNVVGEHVDFVDTASDLFFDLAGGLAALIWYNSINVQRS